MRPKYGEVTTTSVPAAAGTNPSDAQTNPVETRSTLGKEAMPPGSSPDNPASRPIESGAASPAARGANSIAPTKNPWTPRRPTTYVHEALPSSGNLYPAGSGRLVVESNISGARITLNSKSNPKWITPRLFSLAPGTYVVSVSRGAYMTWTRRVHVDDGREQWIMADLENQEGGIFTVDTDPSGMQVFIDGKPFGPSRVETVLRPGWHVCEVIPAPGLPPLVRKFHLSSGEVLTRRIRVGSPAASLGNGRQHLGSSGASLTAGPQGGTP